MRADPGGLNRNRVYGKSRRCADRVGVVGLNWIVERTFGWLGCHRRLSKDYEFKLQTSETLMRSRPSEQS